MVESDLKIPFSPASFPEPASPGLKPLTFEKFNKEHYEDFLKKVAIPYFGDLFYDLAKRDNDGDALYKATWEEYCSLSAMVSERFWSLMDQKSKGYTRKDTFIKVMTQVYLSDLESK